MRRWPSAAPWRASAARTFPLVLTPLWAEGLTGGRGWIAIALVVFAGWRPVRLLAGAYFFGLLGTLELYAKASGAILHRTCCRPRPGRRLPYLATVVVLAIISVEQSRRRQRAGLPRQAVRSVSLTTTTTINRRHVMIKLNRRHFIAGAGAAATLPLLASRAIAADPLKVGYIYVGPINDGGWNTAHEAGRQADAEGARRQGDVASMSRTSPKARTASACCATSPTRAAS